MLWGSRLPRRYGTSARRSIVERVAGGASCIERRRHGLTGRQGSRGNLLRACGRSRSEGSLTCTAWYRCSRLRTCGGRRRTSTRYASSRRVTGSASSTAGTKSAEVLARCSSCCVPVELLHRRPTPQGADHRERPGGRPPSPCRLRRTRSDAADRMHDAKPSQRTKALGLTQPVRRPSKSHA